MLLFTCLFIFVIFTILLPDCGDYFCNGLILFRKLFEGDGIQKLKIILEHIGFIVPEDWESPGAILQFPEADGHLLKSIISLLDGLQGLY